MIKYLVREPNRTFWLHDTKPKLGNHPDIIGRKRKCSERIQQGGPDPLPDCFYTRNSDGTIDGGEPCSDLIKLFGDIPTSILYEVKLELTPCK